MCKRAIARKLLADIQSVGERKTISSSQFQGERTNNPMEDSDKALELTKEFIRLKRQFEKTESLSILEEMKAISRQYTIINGGGDLFSLYKYSRPTK